MHWLTHKQQLVRKLNMDADAGGNEVSLQLNHIHESKQLLRYMIY